MKQINKIDYSVLHDKLQYHVPFGIVVEYVQVPFLIIAHVA